MRAPALVLLFLFPLLAGCASSPSSSGATSIEIPDVHGLALDPTDASILYVATHRGLLRLDDDITWSEVGASRDDFMGFSAHPSDPRTFWASGHPRTGGNLGLIRSADAGASWERIALEGVDFHAMAVSAADASRLYGSWRGQVLRSDDGGTSWSPVAPLAAIGFATHPSARDVVYAATGKSVQRSDDAGLTWTQASDATAIGLAIDPSAPETIYAGTQQGARKSVDGGRTWTPMELPGTIAYFATHAATPGLVYAASYQAGIYKSADAGATWTTVREPSR